MRDEVRMYLSNLLGLLPGRLVWVGQQPNPDVSASQSVPKGSLGVLLPLAESELASEVAALEQVRGRAQFLLTTQIALLGFAIALHPDEVRLRGEIVELIVWAGGAGLLLIALLGAAGVLVSRKTLGAVLALNLTTDAGARRLNETPLKRLLLERTLWAIEVTRLTKNANITVFRDSVLLTLAALALVSLAFLASVDTIDWEALFPSLRAMRSV